jgi:uroporphyrin-III C-methyltransferase / precorrin-2 dehydrogenase / sirohydrochlorin ferrochelatase
MGPLAVLPVFVDLRGRRVVVAGEGDALLWKTELLAAAGADVAVFSERQSPELDALSAAPPAGSIAVNQCRWHPFDLEGAALAVGALTGPDAQAFREAARRHGVPVNIVDSPQASTFSFGSIVNRSPLVIGISTAGAAPVLAQLVRAKIEALLHPVLGAWTEAARHLRAQIKARFSMGAARRDVWRRFAELALAARAAPHKEILARIAGLAVGTAAVSRSWGLVRATQSCSR